MFYMNFKMPQGLRFKFLVITPIILLLAGGVFLKSTHKIIPQTGCVTADYSGTPTGSNKIAMFNGKPVTVPPVPIADAGISNVLGVANPDERWVEVDLSEQKLRAWDGNEVFLETLISTGLPSTPTPTGEFRVWIKLRSTKMEGGTGSGYYYLPNVPYVMYFGNDEVPNWKGFGIHGAYWHNDFGSQRSHGCVNVPTPVAEKLFEWATPILPDGQNLTYASSENKGLRVIIHD